MSDLVSDPLFGRLIGQQIGNNAHAEAAEIRLRSERDLAQNTAVGATGALVSAVGGIVALREQVEYLSSSENGLYASITGVRGVTRELLKELSRSDPNNPLLEKKVRDKIFMEGFNALEPVSRVLSPQQRKEQVPKWTESAFGAEGSGLGGPEKSKITPNKAVRKAAGVPEDHIPDRERFIALIGRLANELKAHDPDASILNEVATVDVMAQVKPETKLTFK